MNEHKIIRVLSRQTFNKYIKELNLTDDTVERADVAIIEFFNSSVCEDHVNRFQIEDEFNYRQGFDSRPFIESHDNVVQIVCDDIIDERTVCIDGEYHSLIPFSEYDAERLYEFIINNKEKKKFIIHCSAGISRSGAAGEFLKRYFNRNYIDVHFPEYNNIRPNGRILSFLERCEKENISF